MQKRNRRETLQIVAAIYMQFLERVGFRGCLSLSRDKGGGNVTGRGLRLAQVAGGRRLKE